MMERRSVSTKPSPAPAAGSSRPAPAPSGATRTDPMALRQPLLRVRSSIVASVGNCVVSAWHDQVTAEDLAAKTKALEAAYRIYPRGVALVVMLPQGLPLVGPTERGMLAQFYRLTGPMLRALGTVVLGDGFWAGAVRGVLTALHAMTPRTYPSRVTASTHQNTAWMCEIKGFTLVDPVGLDLMLERLEAELEAAMSQRPPR